MGNSTVGELYGGVDALPTTFIIDQKRRIAAVHVGLASKSSYERDLNQLLESGPALVALAAVASLPFVARAK